MKTEIKKIDSVQMEIQIEESGDAVKNKFDEVFKRICQEAKVPGFRVGHAPRDIVEKKFSSTAHETVVKELIPDLYFQVVKKENLDVVDAPEITDIKLDRASISFKAKVETRPELDLKNYKGIKIAYKNVEATTDEIKRNLDSLKESRKAAAIDDNFAKSIGYPHAAELEKVMARQIAFQKDNLQRQRIESEIIETVSKGVEVKLPPTLVKRQLDDLVRKAKIDLVLKGVSREQIDEHEKRIVTELEPEARKQIKTYLILAEIAKKENIPADDAMPAKTMELLFREAQWEQEK